jgi:hypothetical protein
MRLVDIRWNSIFAPLALLFAVVLASALGGCTVQLAPDYEPTIIQGLNEYNAQIQTHMASVAAGTRPGLSADQQKAYDDLEGRGRALIMLVKARPQPQSATARWLGSKLADKIPSDGDVSKADIDFLAVPTDSQIEKILAQLAAMENEQKRQGLKPGQYQSYANPINSFMRNALTYEMALKR